MGVSKNSGNTPKMDGEYNGKPYFSMDDLGGKTTISETSIWVFPQMVVPPKHPKIIILVGKPVVFGETHHFRKHPYVDSKATPPVTSDLIFGPPTLIHRGF